MIGAFDLHKDRRELQVVHRGKVPRRLVCSHLRTRTRRGEKPNTEMNEKWPLRFIVYEVQ